jgi:hypothetical protein
LTLFLKVLEKQQEAPLSTGFGAQKLGSRNAAPGEPGGTGSAGTGVCRAAAEAGELQQAPDDNPMFLRGFYFSRALK